MMSPAEPGAEGSRRWSEAETLDDFSFARYFVRVGSERETAIHAVSSRVGVPALNGRSLQCQYRSLSGRTYWTVADFDHRSGCKIIGMRFSSEPRSVG